MKLVIEKAAVKGLSRMPAKVRAGLVAKLAAIAAAPFATHLFDVKVMRGEQDLFRVRQGDWRAVYRVIRLDDITRVLVVDVRGSVYE